MESFVHGTMSLDRWVKMGGLFWEPGFLEGLRVKRNHFVDASSKLTCWQENKRSPVESARHIITVHPLRREGGGSSEGSGAPGTQSGGSGRCRCSAQCGDWTSRVDDLFPAWG